MSSYVCNDWQLNRIVSYLIYQGIGECITGYNAYTDDGRQRLLNDMHEMNCQSVEQYYKTSEGRRRPIFEFTSSTKLQVYKTFRHFLYNCIPVPRGFEALYDQLEIQESYLAVDIVLSLPGYEETEV